jgi:hypothetical protein
MKSKGSEALPFDFARHIQEQSLGLKQIVLERAKKVLEDGTVGRVCPLPTTTLSSVRLRGQLA